MNRDEAIRLLAIELASLLPPPKVYIENLLRALVQPEARLPNTLVDRADYDRLLRAAMAVVAYDWSDNDDDAVEAVARLSLAVQPAPPSDLPVGCCAVVDASRIDACMACIEAADEMRRELICPLVGKKAGRCNELKKPCWTCQCAIDYDAKRAAVGESK